MRYLFLMSVVFISIMIPGCGTFFAISELDLTNKGHMENPDGLVINRRGQYEVGIVGKGKDKDNKETEIILQLSSDSGTVTGVDHNIVIKLDVTRMPFSDGKLNVELNDFQLMKKVELTSKTGADKAAKAAQTGTDTHTKIKTLLKPVQNNTDSTSK